MLLQAFYGIRSRSASLWSRMEFDPPLCSAGSWAWEWTIRYGTIRASRRTATGCCRRARSRRSSWPPVLAQPKVKRLLSSDHFWVDGTLLEAWASIKSFRRKDGDDNDSTGPGRNAERHFHKEKRSNETHRSVTDPEARLYKKGSGQPAEALLPWAMP